MYAPVIHSASTKKYYDAPGYRAAFLDDIQSAQDVGYEYIIVVFEDAARDPFLFVASERNDPVAERASMVALGLWDPDDETEPERTGESHFLCVFDENGHSNMGDSNDWGDADLFEKAALSYLEKRLGVAFEERAGSGENT